jgi:hypothetical protein
MVHKAKLASSNRFSVTSAAAAGSIHIAKLSQPSYLRAGSDPSSLHLQQQQQLSMTPSSKPAPLGRLWKCFAFYSGKASGTSISIARILQPAATRESQDGTTVHSAHGLLLAG